MRSICILTLCACILVGCSVKEDRSSCPRFLKLDFSKVDTERWKTLEVRVMGLKGFRFNDNVTVEEFDDYYVEVPEDEVFVNVFSLDGDGYQDGRGLIIPEGHDCPDFHLHASHLSDLPEYLTDTIKLHKNCCLLSMTMTTDGQAVTFALEVNGNVCGYGIDGEPVSGSYNVRLNPGEKGYCSFGLPRQIDQSLSLRILDGDDSLREFALGEYINRSGYDWTAPDLEDIQMEIDFSRTRIHFCIGEWEQTVSFEVEI